jgi:O-antigen ligase
MRNGIALTLISLLAGVLFAWFLEKLNVWKIGLIVIGIPLAFYGVFALTFAWIKLKRLLGKLRWWHILWLLVFLSGQTFRMRSTQMIEETPLYTATLFRVGLMGIVGIVLLGVFLLRYSGKVSIFRGLIGAMTSYSLICIVSTLWSVYPSWTLYKSLEYFIEVALIAVIVYQVKHLQDFKPLFDWTWMFIGLLMLSVWLGVLLWPSEAINYGIGLLGIQIKGVFPVIAENGVGELGALLSIVSFVRFLYVQDKSRGFYLFLFLFGLVTLIFSQSRSPLIGFVLAIPLILILDHRISLLAFAGLILPALLLLTSAGELFWQFFKRNQSEELFFSLSGRIYYWEFALPLIFDRPVLGYGAYAAGRFLVALHFHDLLSSLHGTYLEVLIGTGILGIIPLLVAVLGTWWVLIRDIQKRHLEKGSIVQQLRLEAVGVMTLLTVRSIFSVSFIWHPALTWLLVLGYAEYLRRNHTRSCYP